MAAASITKQTKAVAVVVSESSIVRVFDDGEIISEIIPELWMFARYSSHLAGQISEIKEEDLTIVSKAEWGLAGEHQQCCSADRPHDGDRLIE